MHDGLSNVNDFRRIGPKAMHAQYFERVAMKQDFEHADLLTCNLSSRQTLELSLPYFVRNTGCRELSFRFSNRTNLWAGVDTGGNVMNPEITLCLSHQMHCCRSTLCVSGTCKGGKTNHITDSMNVLHSGLKLTINIKLSAFIRHQANVL